MLELHSQLENIQNDNAYEVIDVLKDGALGRTEKVRRAQQIFVRKYFSLDLALPEDELKIIANLSHPCLPETHEYYSLSDRIVLIQEYINGLSLSDLIQYSGGLTVQKAIIITSQLCDVVSFLHTQKPNPIIHRDIKPDNIVCTEERIMLIDFGAARTYKVGNFKDTTYFGTIGYAPPEQFGFGQTDERSDIYAIGMTLYHMVSGIPPERGEKDFLLNTKVPENIRGIIVKAIEFDPAKRYLTVGDFADDLKQCYNSEKTNVPHKQPRFDLFNRIPPSNRIFPKQSKLPAAAKLLLFPIHVLLPLTFLFSIVPETISLIRSRSITNFLQLSYSLIGFIYFLFPSYIMGFNFFNLNERLGLFQNHRIIKKIGIALLLLLVGGIMLPIFKK